MQVFPTNLPAQIRLKSDQDGEAVIVAHGPLPIMTMGIMALSPEDRDACRIFSELGEMTYEEALAVLDNLAEQV